MTIVTFTLDGSAIRDIPSLYAELDRLLMSDEDWRLGASLDALNDLLSGGFGALSGLDRARIVWNDSATSRAALGVGTTAEYYREKLRRPDLYRSDHFRQKLDELEAGTGQTYFDIVLEVFAEHVNVELVLN